MRNNKCIIDIPQDIYNKLVFISNEIGVTINELLTQSIVTDEFRAMIDIMFNNIVKLSQAKQSNQSKSSLK